MYVDWSVFLKASEVIGALGVIIGFIVAIYKLLKKIDKIVENNQKQNEVINSMQEEQTILCYGLKGALQGLIEKGCDGPCKEALNLLDKHLNKTAHKPDL